MTKTKAHFAIEKAQSEIRTRFWKSMRYLMTNLRPSYGAS